MITYGALWDMGDDPIFACPVQCAIAGAFHEILPADRKHQLTKFLPRLIQAEDFSVTADRYVVDARYQKMGDDVAFVYVPMLCSFANAIHPNVPLKGMVGTGKFDISQNCLEAFIACKSLGLTEIGAGFDAAYFATCNGFPEWLPLFDMYMSLRFPSRVLKAIGWTIEQQPPYARAWCYDQLCKAMNATMEGLLAIGNQGEPDALDKHELGNAVLALETAMQTTYTFSC